MKFFNWVHKRFHHPLPKEHEFVQNVEKSHDHEVLHSTNDKDTQALLKKVVLIDALDGWKDGILAIGTFGFDPLKPLINQQKEYLVLESEGDDEEESQEYSFEGSTDIEDEDEDSDDTTHEDEEVNPLMLSTLGHSFKGVNSSNSNAGKQNVLLSLNGVPLSSNDELIATQVNSSLQSEEKKKVGRTTLADLFLADADVKMKLDSEKVFPADIPTKKLNARTKKSLSFAKKFIPGAKEKTTPIKNIQRLMRRMLKRKIHPEALDVKVSKSSEADWKAADAIELVAIAPKQASESVSLLSMQGATSEI